MAWPYWLLLSLAALAAALLLALHLFRFRYSFDYDFPYDARGRMDINFLWLRKILPFGEKEEEEEEEEKENPVSGATLAPAEGAAHPPASGPGGLAGPMQGQGGFVAMPSMQGQGGYVAMPSTRGQSGFAAMPWKAAWGERYARLKQRLKAAAKKWILDLAVWGRLSAYLLHTGLRALRFAGPSMERLHVGSGDVYALGRFAGYWSSLAGMAPFLACPVEYAFNESPFTLRFRVSGGCTALGLIAFLAVVFFTFPWIRLLDRFLFCWRNPRLNRWQRKLAAAMA